MIKAALYEAPSLSVGIREQGIELIGQGESIFIWNKKERIFCDSQMLLSQTDFEKLKLAISQNEPSFRNQLENPDSFDLSSAELQSSASTIDVLNEFKLDIANDIDDEQINGRNRRRQKRARTNTR
jgi:hypothetical protein